MPEEYEGKDYGRRWCWLFDGGKLSVRSDGVSKCDGLAGRGFSAGTDFVS